MIASTPDPVPRFRSISTTSGRTVRGDPHRRLHVAGRRDHLEPALTQVARDAVPPQRMVVHHHHRNRSRPRPPSRVHLRPALLRLPRHPELPFRARHPAPVRRSTAPPSSATRPRMDFATPSRPSASAAREPPGRDAGAVVAHAHHDVAAQVLEQHPRVRLGRVPGHVGQCLPHHGGQFAGQVGPAASPASPAPRRPPSASPGSAAVRAQVDVAARGRVRRRGRDQRAQRDLLLTGQPRQLRRLAAQLGAAPLHPGQHLQHAVVDGPGQPFPFGGRRLRTAARAPAARPSGGRSSTPSRSPVRSRPAARRPGTGRCRRSRACAKLTAASTTPEDRRRRPARCGSRPPPPHRSPTPW